MYKIGVISDTHGLLRAEVTSIIKSCDVILHAGDINTLEMVSQLESMAPLYVVRGNNDKGEWAEQLPITLKFEIKGYSFFMTHQKKDIPKELEKVDFIIYGHSHQYKENQEKESYYLNPGSCGKRRFGLPITMAILYIEEHGVRIEKVEFEC